MNQTYIVKSGDTLYGISNQYGVSIMDLETLNNVKANNLQIGQVLKIPNNTGNNPSSTFIYTIKKGDSLYKIANEYNTNVDYLIKLNNLKNTNLSIGQKISVPENYSSGGLNKPNYINYTVKSGDSLYKIANLYNVSVDTIKKDNSLNSNLLSIGQNLKIRVENNSDQIEECYGNAYILTNNISYTVKRGDTLYSISKKYNISVDSIKKKNNLTSNILNIGQVLIL